jgi:subtilisin family serine protease
MISGVSSRRVRAAAIAVCVVAISCAAVAWASASTTPAGTSSSVIVVLRNQLHSTPDKLGYRDARAKAAATTQAPLVAGVQSAGGRVTNRFQLLNSFVATVSPAELKRLRSDPAVSAIYPNVAIPITSNVSPPQPLAWGTSGPSTTPSLDGAIAPSISPASTSGISRGLTPDTSPAPTGSAVCGTASDPLLEPEALQLTHTAASANEAAGTYESSTGITGAGVTVAAIADGVDTTNPDLQRGGQPVVTQVDFGGQGAGVPTDGYEMFGDVSSIAAQGTTTYDISNPSISGISDNTAALGASGSGCDIRVRGIAPGANVYALDTTPASGGTTEDAVAAINYAVNTAHANVINESFGGNPIPDDAVDVIRAADQQAFQAGVTVVVSSGDSGPTQTVDAPSSDPDVISVAASTAERAYTQAAIYGGGLASASPVAGFQGGSAGSPDGWVDNSVTSFSSGGIDEGGTVPDLIAPGEAGWALCSTNTTLFTECGGHPLEQFQGTSESAPLVAGAAALVIQAYKLYHGGALPGPALVKQILMSSADDIDASSGEQGAGLLDTNAAVLAAESPTVGTGASGSPQRSQTGILVSTSSNVGTPAPSGAKPGQIDVSGTAGSTQNATVTVTNTGSQNEIVMPALRGLTQASAPVTGQVNLDGTDPTYRNGHGDTLRYVAETFTVPAGTDVLTALAAWPGGVAGDKTVILSLTDPAGRWAGSSVYWGGTDTAFAEVDQPEAGTWTAYVTTQGGYDGVVNYSFTSSKFASTGSVSPGTLTLAPGAQGTLTVPFTIPSQGSDASENLNLSTALASAPNTTLATNVVPVALRSLVALGASGGTFSGIAAGGNGWNGPGGTGQISTYDMNVPAGKPALVVDLNLPSDLGASIDGYLIDPEGEDVSLATGAGGQELENVHLNPEAGTWQYVVQDDSVNDGTLADSAHTYTGTVRFAVPETVTPTGVPDSASSYIAPGSTAQAALTFANGGPTTQDVFVDPRTTTYEQMPLAEYNYSEPIALPNTSPGADGNQPAVIVPTGTDALSATTESTATGGGGLSGVGFDFASGNGGPDLGSSISGSGGVSTASIGVDPTLPDVSQGYWYLTPSYLPPFTSGAAVGSLSATVTATMLGFDTTVTSSTGDNWLYSVDPDTPTPSFASIVSGASANITVTFAPPSGTPVGTVVKGTLQVDNASDVDQNVGDVLAEIPYEYTVGTAPPPVTTTTATTATTPPTTTTTKTTPIAVVRAKLGRAKVRGTTVGVPVSCPKTARTACKVTLKLTVAEKLKGGKVIAVAASAKPRTTTRTLVAGSTTVTVAPGKSKTAEVALNKAAKQLLNKRHTLPALLTFTQGTTKLPSQHVSFKATTKK